MRIDFQIPAHLRQQVAADFFLAILEGGEFFAEVQTTMAALALTGHKLAGDLLAACQLLYSPLELRTLHSSILGQICPNIKWRMSAARQPADPLTDSQIVNSFQRRAASAADRVSGTVYAGEFREFRGQSYRMSDGGAGKWGHSGR